MTILIRKDDFPFYQNMIDSQIDGQSKNLITNKFNTAANGSDKEKYSFTLMMQQLVRDFDSSPLVKSTEAIKQTTLTSCIATFDALANHGNMTADYIYAAETMAGHTKAELNARKNNPTP